MRQLNDLSVAMLGFSAYLAAAVMVRRAARRAAAYLRGLLTRARVSPAVLPTYDRDCDRCLFDRHVCGRCGDLIAHNVTECAACEAIAARAVRPGRHRLTLVKRLRPSTRRPVMPPAGHVRWHGRPEDHRPRGVVGCVWTEASADV